MQVGAVTVCHSLYECGCKNQNPAAPIHITPAAAEEIIAIFFFFGIFAFL
jgi:hypothetical protein